MCIYIYSYIFKYAWKLFILYFWQLFHLSKGGPPSNQNKGQLEGFLSLPNYMGVSLNGGFPPKLHPKCWSFLVGKTHGKLLGKSTTILGVAPIYNHRHPSRHIVLNDSSEWQVPVSFSGKVSQDASHHQDSLYIFRIGEIPNLKPLFATGILGGGRSKIYDTLGPQNHEKWRFKTPIYWVITPKNEGFGFITDRISQR